MFHALKKTSTFELVPIVYILHISRLNWTVFFTFVFKSSLQPDVVKDNQISWHHMYKMRYFDDDIEGVTDVLLMIDVKKCGLFFYYSTKN